MIGTNAVRAKRSLIAGIRMALADESTTDQVTVTYAYRGHEDFRELVHGGHVSGPQSYPVSQSVGPYPRDEDLTIKVHAVVHIPGGDQEEAEQRLEDILNVIGDMIAATAALPGFEPGEITSAGVTAVDVDSDADDDEATAVGTLDIAVSTRLN